MHVAWRGGGWQGVNCGHWQMQQGGRGGQLLGLPMPTGAALGAAQLRPAGGRGAGGQLAAGHTPEAWRDDPATMHPTRA